MITILGIVAVTVTHHITSICPLRTFLRRSTSRNAFLDTLPAERRYLGIFAALTGILAAFWFF